MDVAAGHLVVKKAKSPSAIGVGAPADCDQPFRLIATTHSGGSRPGCGRVLRTPLGDLLIGNASPPSRGSKASSRVSRYPRTDRRVLAMASWLRLIWLRA